jgi:imidazolonepropionase-like amidohydrolase/lysophospholipase L1-like esterase
MAFGDSITAGEGSSDESGYRSRLQQLLRARGGDAVVIDEGKPGADSRRGLRSIVAALERQRPDATLILLGTNDWAEPPREPVSTANALRKVVREVKARGGRAYLATIPPVNVGFDANELIRAMAREEGATLVDVHAALVAAAPAKSLFADGVHPNDAGYAVIAKAFLEAIVAQPPASSGLKALRFGKLWDGTGRVLTNALVVVEKDRVRSVEPGAAAPPGAQLVDLSAYTGLPGLIDAHTHATYGPMPGNRSPIVNAFLARDILSKTLEAGVTTIRDMNASDYADIALRDLVSVGQLAGPRIFTVGCGLRVTRAPYRGAAQPACGVADGADEVTRAARQQLAAGADWVKMFASTGSGQDVSGTQTYTFDEIRAAADAVHALGKRLAVHSYGPAGARDAVRAGADSVEHATDLDDETIAEMARRGTWYVPTIDHNRYYAENGDTLGYAAGYKERLEDYIRRNLDTARKAHKAGVRFVMGSDAIYTMHGENTRELGWFVKAGMSPEQALSTATRNAAQMLGQPDAIGVVKPGAFADIVAVAGDPVSDVGAVLQGVRFVMKGGQVVVDKTAAR